MTPSAGRVDHSETMAETMVNRTSILGSWVIPIEYEPHINHYWLVVSTPLKNMNVNWDAYSQSMGKCQIHGNQSPPTRL